MSLNLEDLQQFELDDSDISLDDPKIQVGKPSFDWLTFTKKGEKKIGAFVYFYRLEEQVLKALAGKGLSADEKISKVQEALDARAKELGKSVSELEDWEKLDISQARLKITKSQYKEGIGNVVTLLGKGSGADDLVWKQLGDVRTQVSTAFLEYPLKVNGDFDSATLAAQIQEDAVVIKPWKFGGKTYDTIKSLSDGYKENGISLAAQNIVLECTDLKFKAISVGVKGPAVWIKTPKSKEVVLKAALNIYPHITPARELTTEQLREKLGIAEAASGGLGKDVSSTEFDSLLDSVWCWIKSL